MATAINLDRLKEPFAPEDLEWRVQSAGEKNGKFWARVLCYVTARAIMDRLDEVCGPENWRDSYRQGPAGGVLAGIGIRVDDEWIWKWDGAENTDIEAVKGGLSNALKRAAVKWGIGRYLYRIEESFAIVHDGGAYRGKTKDGKTFRWDPPDLPAWALPAAPPPATEDQLRAIDRLAVERVIPAKQEEALKRRLAAGLTQAGADDAIRWLESLPMAQEPAV